MLPGVLLIWGFLGWKLYAAMKDDESLPVTSVVEATPDDGNNVIPDTYQLLLDYPDPFLGKSTSPVKFNPNPNPVKNNTTSTPAIIPKQTNEWPEIKYSGLVKSPKDGKMVGFLNVNGQSHFVKNGDQVDVIVVKILWNDSARVSMGKEVRTFRK